MPRCHSMICGLIGRGNIMGLKTPKMMKQAQNTLKQVSIAFGRISSGNSSTVNIQNTADGDIRDLRIITPYGISSCPTTGLFAQMIINDNTNNVCVGVHDPKAPVARAGEIILYSSGGAYIKLGADGIITIKSVKVNFI
jgi:phage gp45-like